VAKAGEPPRRFVKEIEILDAWKLPSVENLKKHGDILTAIFAARNDCKKREEIMSQRNIQRIRLPGRLSPIVKELHEEIKCTGDQPVSDWEISFLDRVPEDYNDDPEVNESVVCLLYRARGETGPGAFYVGNVTDWWTERSNAACRRMAFNVEPPDDAYNVQVQGCDVFLEHKSTELLEEIRRCEIALKRTGSIPFPIQSAVYRFNWEMMVKTPTR
jgi:hypothetical protein